MLCYELESIRSVDVTFTNRINIYGHLRLYLYIVDIKYIYIMLVFTYISVAVSGPVRNIVTRPLNKSVLPPILQGNFKVYID